MAEAELYPANLRHTPLAARPGPLILLAAMLAAVPTYLHARFLPDPAWRVGLVQYLQIAAAVTALLLGFGMSRLFVSAQESRVHLGAPGATLEDVVPGARRAARWLLAIFVTANAVWLVRAVEDGLTLELSMRAIAGEDFAAFVTRRVMLDASIPGITTWTEVGPVLAALLAYLKSHKAPYRASFAILLIGATLRAFLAAERLAVLGILVPFMVVLFVADSRSGRRSSPTPRARSSGLYVFPLLLPLLFAIFERGRSWGGASREAGPGLLGYSLSRLFEYYATATNNGVIYVQEYLPATGDGSSVSLGFVTQLPIVGTWIMQPPRFFTWQDVLRANGVNPEYTNVGGFLPIFGELGSVAGLLLFVALGFALHLSFHRSVAGQRAYAYCLYGFTALSVVELPRQFLATSGRAIPAYVAVALVAFFASNPGRRRDMKRRRNR